ncbi:MAG: hypothetical protein IJ741_05545 [Schwartzia sp.]|nr:hypothetical protein [Schwartzia sp. (in: firmicutes)]
MAMYVSPLLFTSGTNPAAANVSPVMAATVTKPGKTIVSPLLFATVFDEDTSITVKLKADTLRELEAVCQYSFATQRIVKGEEHDITLRFDVQRKIIRSVALAFDSARTVTNRLRYTNKGISDALFSFGGTVMTDASKTDTGTGVTGKEGAYMTPLETALGFSAIDEIWARWDAWLPAGNGQAAITWLFFVVNGTRPWPSGISGGYVLFSDAAVGNIPSLTEGIHKFVMHIGRSGMELFIDDELAVSASGSLPEDTLWTQTAIHTGDQVLSNIIVANYDISRESLVKVRKHISLSFGTIREVCRVIDRRYAASRSLPHRIEPGKGNLQSVTLRLAESTLSDTFEMATTSPVQPKDGVRGKLLDFPYSFQAEEVREEGILFTVKRTMYNADKMLYTTMTYSLDSGSSSEYWDCDGKRTSGVQASVHAGKIAGAMGLSPVYMAQDFFPRDSYADTQTTYQSILSGVFGWTKNVPRMQINIFIRGNRLYFLQRGHETGIVDLANVPWFDRPVFDRRVMRTTWNQDAEPDDTDIPIAGGGMVHKKIYWIEDSPKTPTPSDDGVNTVYENVSRGGGSRLDNRIKYTERTNPDGSVTRTDYEYIDTGRDYLLRKITEETSFPSGEVYKTRITKYTYTSDGWRHMVVTENNEVVEESVDATGSAAADSQVETGSSAWRGRPGDMGNDHMDEQVALSHGGQWKKSGTSKGDSFLSHIPADAPALDADTCRAYRRELEWMDRRIEEKATLTITAPVCQGKVAAGGNHVMDFFDRYRLNGQEYYLVSNTVTLTPRNLKQALTLVRWY